MIYYLKYFICLLFICHLFSANAQEDGGRKLRNSRKNPIVKTRIGFSPVLGIYQTNPRHATKAKAKMAFNISLKQEIRLDKKNKDFLLVGVEYMFHGTHFNSYYFNADSLQLYTPDRLRYRYDLTIHELDFPIQIKHSFQSETNTLTSAYIYAGYCYRWIFEGKLKVSDNGNEIENHYEAYKFKSPAFNPVNSSFLNAGFGVQKNTLFRHNAVYAELQFRYALSTFYFNESFAASSLYTNGHFVLLTVGFKL